MRRLKLFGRKSHQEDDIECPFVPVMYRGILYEIPVDGDGFVPVHALAQRFQEVGITEDIDSDSPVILPQRCTPEQIIQWWADPSSCDIQGIDTEDPEIYDTSSLDDPEMRFVQRKIAVVTPEADEQARIRKILAESFTSDELREMSRNGSFVIKTLSYCGDATGCYLRRQDGIEVPLIVIETKTTPDGIVHEVVHHARAVDRSRDGILKSEFPTENGKFSQRLMDRLSKKRQKEILENEEKETVAETVVRTRTDPVQSGYYDSVPSRNARSAYVDDRRMLTQTPIEVPEEYIPRLRGEAAKRAVEKGYAYTNIARAEILSRNVRKGEQR